MPRPQSIAFFGLLALLGAAGCHHAAPPAPEPVPAVNRLYYDNGGGIEDSVRMVVRDAQSLRSVWQQATSQQSSPPPVPTIDFKHQMVLVVAAGRMTPEDQIHVDSLSFARLPDAQGHLQRGLRVVVDVTRGCTPFNAAAYPLEMVRVPRVDGPVQFVQHDIKAQGCNDGPSSPTSTSLLRTTAPSPNRRL